MLFEMLQGEVVTDGWRSHEVKEALDLCISCKGCKGDCPVSVDMATFKAEFLSHYYKGRLRPRTAYSIGWIWWAARVASKAPRLVNAVTHAPLLAPAVKWLGGIDQQREIPRFAAPTFRRWFAAREPHNLDGPPVLLWPDTFNNYLEPEVARAAVEVLEDAGYQVRIPERTLCCGRPLYDFGMLDLAKRLLLQVLDAIRPAIREGIPVVGLEPSCVTVFRDELVNLFPDDEDARRLAGQTFTLAELLDSGCCGLAGPGRSGSRPALPGQHGDGGAGAAARGACRRPGHAGAGRRVQLRDAGARRHRAAHPASGRGAAPRPARQGAGRRGSGTVVRSGQVVDAEADLGHQALAERLAGGAAQAADLGPPGRLAVVAVAAGGPLRHRRPRGLHGVPVNAQPGSPSQSVPSDDQADDTGAGLPRLGPAGGSSTWSGR